MNDTILFSKFILKLMRVKSKSRNNFKIYYFYVEQREGDGSASVVWCFDNIKWQPFATNQ